MTRKRLLLLHINILIFSFTGVLSKLIADAVNSGGIWNFKTIALFVLMLLNCAVYALFWQQNIKHVDANIAYSHKSVYSIWSLLWSVLLFHEAVTPGNIIGTIIIIAGVVLINHE